MFWNSTKDIRACCTISKRYERGKEVIFWYAFHPRWHEFLKEAEKAYYILGCVGNSSGYAIPLNLLEAHLDDLYITEREDRMYWHIELVEEENQMFWLLRKANIKIPLQQYEVALG